jgi:hypothetical protein
MRGTRQLLFTESESQCENYDVTTASESEAADCEKSRKVVSKRNNDFVYGQYLGFVDNIMYIYIFVYLQTNLKQTVHRMKTLTCP